MRSRVRSAVAHSLGLGRWPVVECAALLPAAAVYAVDRGVISVCMGTSARCCGGGVGVKSPVVVYARLLLRMRRHVHHVVIVIAIVAVIVEESLAHLRVWRPLRLCVLLRLHWFHRLRLLVASGTERHDVGERVTRSGGSGGGGSGGGSSGGGGSGGGVTGRSSHSSHSSHGWCCRLWVPTECGTAFGGAADWGGRRRRCGCLSVVEGTPLGPAGATGAVA